MSMFHELMMRKKIKEENFIINKVGNPTIVDGVVSNFTVNDYLISANNFPSDKAIQNFEFFTKFSVSDISQQMTLFCFYFDEAITASGLWIPENANRIRWFVSSNNNIQYTSMQVNQIYYLKCVISNNKMMMYIGTTKDNMTLVATKDIVPFELSGQNPVWVGRRRYTTNQHPATFASLYIKDTYHIIDNVKYNYIIGE